MKIDKNTLDAIDKAFDEWNDAVCTEMEEEKQEACLTILTPLFMGKYLEFTRDYPTQEYIYVAKLKPFHNWVIDLIGPSISIKDNRLVSEAKYTILDAFSLIGDKRDEMLGSIKEITKEEFEEKIKKYASNDIISDYGNAKRIEGYIFE